MRQLGVSLVSQSLRRTRATWTSTNAITILATTHPNLTIRAHSSTSLVNPASSTPTSDHQHNTDTNLAKPIPFIYEELSDTPPPPPPIQLPQKRQTSNIALFLDLDNVLIGEIFPNFGRDNRKLQLTIIDSILNACKGRGRVVVKWAYGDAIRYKDLRPDFHQRAVDMKDTPPHQRAAAKDGGKNWVVPPKNSADIKMVVDAMELAYTNDHIDTYVLASGDSDFTPILSKLRELGKHTIVISLPERLSWRLEEYSDETLSLTELFRNRVIDGSEYENALRGIYAGYELESKLSKSEKYLNCFNGGPKFLPVSAVKNALQLLAHKQPEESLNVRGTNNNDLRANDASSDVEWALNTKGTEQHIQVIRGPKGKQFIRPLVFDRYYDAPGPSTTTPGGLTRKDRFKILENKLFDYHLDYHSVNNMPSVKNLSVSSLRHVSAKYAIEAMITWVGKEGETVPVTMSTTNGGLVRMRAGVISHVSVFTQEYLSTHDLPKLGNRHIRAVVDLAVASKALVVGKFDPPTTNNNGKQGAKKGKYDDHTVYKLAPGVATYEDIREKIDEYIMTMVLFELESNIVPDALEWYSLLYDENMVNADDSSGFRDGRVDEGEEDNEGNEGNEDGSEINQTTENIVMKGLSTQEQSLLRRKMRREKKNNESGTAKTLEAHEYEYLKRVERKAREQHALLKDGKATDENDTVQEKEEPVGFFARLFG